jgi:TetR/AcrR family fatty acid metabolism transcriptional regulator
VARRSPDELKEVIRDFRRDQIIDVARRLFGARGTTEVSMDEIALEAGVARSTVYVYFANRSELLRACLQHLYELAQASIEASWGERPTPERRLAAVVGGLLERVDEDPVFLRLTVAAQASGSSEGAAVDAELVVIGLEVAGILYDLVDEGVAAGTFRAIDPGRGAALIGQQIWGALAVRAGDPNPVPLDEAVDEIVTFLLAGLRA